MRTRLTPNKLIEDLQVVVHDAEALLQATAGETRQTNPWQVIRAAAGIGLSLALLMSRR